MGQKIHPSGLRLGITQEHRSKWFATSKTYPILLQEDFKIRTFIQKKYGAAGISDVLIACLLYTSPSPRDATLSRMPSSA